MPSRSNPRISEAGAPDISDWGPACQAVLTNEFFGRDVPAKPYLGRACQLTTLALTGR